MIERKLRAQYTIEAMQDLRACYSINVQDEILKLIHSSVTHKQKLQYELEKLQRKSSGHFKTNEQFKRVQMLQEIKQLKHIIKNHKKYYPEEYI